MIRQLRAAGLWLVVMAGPVLAQSSCAPTDFLTIPLNGGGDRIGIALEAAYPGSRMDRAAGVFVTADGRRVPFRPARRIDPAGRLQGATIGDQFQYLYPLSFDLTARKQSYYDPGRIRDDGFFRALYFADKRAAQRSLVTVQFTGRTRSASFRATRKHCVHAQLQAALNEIASHSPAIDRFFESVGGSFNWRLISGTTRLSAHSFGIAVDFNSQLGGYWRWSGAKPGHAEQYDNKVPAVIVEAMERYGFIWGGKWHHFDGMHFEYRPELILYARLAGDM